MRDWVAGVVVVWLMAALGCGEHPAAAAVRGAPRKASSTTAPPKRASVVPEGHARAFGFLDDFEQLPDPEPGDWRFEHPEPSEDFASFLAARPHVVSGPRRVVYVLPIGELVRAGGPAVDELREHTERYFGLEVAVLDPVTIKDVGATNRRNEGRRQMLASEVLDYLRTRVPADAYCVLGLTMVDLYPGPSWNYVFGLASTHDRVGIFSFHRYDPRFYDPTAEPDPELVLERGLKVMTHELGHMFGMGHCDHFRCVLNGINHVEELDASPLHLCPVCLRKLDHVTDLDLSERYRRLRDYYERRRMPSARTFVSRRLWRIEQGGG